MRNVFFAANGGALIYGMSLGWSGPNGPRILSPEHSFPISDQDFSIAVAMMPFGAALSCIVSGLFRNRFGSKTTILLFSLPNFIGWSMLLLASNPLMMIIGRLLVGIAGGAYAFNLPVFIGELSSKEIRGVLLTFFQAILKSGVVLSYSLSYFVELFTLHTVCLSILAVYFIGFLFLPESPTYLVRKKQLDKADRSIKTLRGKNYDSAAEISELQQAHEKALSAQKSSFRNEIKKRSTLKAFFIVVTMFFFFQMSGINPIIFYTTSLFIEAKVSMDPAIATIILGCSQVLMTLSTMFFIDKFGRRFLMKVSFSIMCLGQIGIGTYFLMKETDATIADTLGWLPLVALIVFSLGFSFGMASVPYILLGEIFSNEAKKVVAPIAQTMNFAISSVIIVLYPTFVKTVGAGFTFYGFAGFCFLGLLFTIFIQPETKGKSLAEIQKLLES